MLVTIYLVHHWLNLKTNNNEGGFIFIVHETVSDILQN